tara:strand:- start:104 stop:400 length:297 start_codon:yes stop_codon:yes gene_type:complete
MSTEHVIRGILENAYPDAILNLINESNMHSGNRKDSHFKLIIVDDKFNELPLIARHKDIYKSLGEVINTFHALAIHAYTHEEYSKIDHAPKSPSCSKK